MTEEVSCVIGIGSYLSRPPAQFNLRLFSRTDWMSASCQLFIYLFVIRIEVKKIIVDSVMRRRIFISSERASGSICFSSRSSSRLMIRLVKNKAAFIDRSSEGIRPSFTLDATKTNVHFSNFQLEHEINNKWNRIQFEQMMKKKNSFLSIRCSSKD